MAALAFTTIARACKIFCVKIFYLTYQALNKVHPMKPEIKDELLDELQKITQVQRI